MEQIVRIGMDTSKQVFQLHGVNASEEPCLQRKLRRSELIAFFDSLEPTVVGIEASGAAHHWARTIGDLGHEVKIIAPQFVKPYVKRGKNDAADAEALCEAMSRPTMRFVPAKSVEQQAALMLVSLRSRLVRSRTQLSNAIRGHAAEFGLIAGRGVDKIRQLLRRLQEDEDLPELAGSLFRELEAEFEETDTRLRRVDAALTKYHRDSELCQRLSLIPGIGPVSSTMLALKTPDPGGFRSARHFAAWIGLTPKDHSSGGTTRLGGITRAGDEALRSALIVGATAVIRQMRRGSGRRWPWLELLLQRKPPKLAAVALANKLARIAWKLMNSGESYNPGHAMRAL